MPRLDLDDGYRRRANGTIDHDHYRKLAAALRRDSRRQLLLAAVAAFYRYVRLPQKR